MASENGTFTGPDGTRIFYQCWLPEKKVKGALVIVHGLGEHSGRYMNLVNHFEPLGFSYTGWIISVTAGPEDRGSLFPDLTSIQTH